MTKLEIRSTDIGMESESIEHTGLRQFFLTGKSQKLVGSPDRLKKMLAFIVAAESLDELSIPPNYGLHQLTGKRAGTWSMTMTRNWRLTFQLNEDNALINLNLEDYHGT